MENFLSGIPLSRMQFQPSFPRICLTVCKNVWRKTNVLRLAERQMRNICWPQSCSAVSAGHWCSARAEQVLPGEPTIIINVPLPKRRKAVTRKPYRRSGWKIWSFRRRWSWFRMMQWLNESFSWSWISKIRRIPRSLCWKNSSGKWTENWTTWWKQSRKACSHGRPKSVWMRWKRKRMNWPPKLLTKS